MGLSLPRDVMFCDLLNLKSEIEVKLYDLKRCVYRMQLNF
jgi:hypothetical protein